MECCWLCLQGDGKCLFHSKVMHGHAEVPGHRVGGTCWKNVFIWHLLNACAQNGLSQGGQNREPWFHVIDNRSLALGVLESSG